MSRAFVIDANTLPAMTFITRYIAQHSISPSNDELKTALQLSSKSVANKLVEVLITRGSLVRAGPPGQRIARGYTLPRVREALRREFTNGRDRDDKEQTKDDE